MTEVAALGLRADSKGIVEATEDLKDLAVAARGAENAAEDLGRGAASSTGNVVQMGRAAQVAGASSFQASGGVRMLGMQISQVVQQTAAGGSVFQAFAIQAADIGAMFGVIGTAIGIVATIAIPTIVAAFSGMSEQATADVKRVKEAWDDLLSATYDAQIEIDKLRFGVDEQYQVELLREQVRLREEYNAKVAELNVYLATSTANIDRQRIETEGLRGEIEAIASRYHEIDRALADQGSKAVILALSEGRRAQEAATLAAKQEQAAAAAERAAGFAQTVANLYAQAAGSATTLYRETAAAQGAAAALAGLSFGNISLAAGWAATLAANMRAAATAQSNMMTNGQTTGSTSWFYGQTADSLLPPVAGLIPGASPGGGGGGASDRSSDLSGLLEELQTERETLTAWYSERLDLINSFTDAELAAVGGRHGALERLEAEHLLRLSGLQEGYQGDTLSKAGQFFGDMEAAMQSGNEGMLRVAKLFGAAEALINAYRAGSQVLADPTLPWYAKVPAAMSIIATGAGFANAIKGGGGSGSGARTSRSAGATAATTQASRPQDVIFDFSATMNPAMRALAQALFEPMVAEMQKASKTGINIVGVKY